MFNVIKYFKDFNIHIPEDGKNSNFGWVNIRCVFCADNSDHLGFNLKENYFKCWNCGYHSIYETIHKLSPDENPTSLIKEYDTNSIVTNKIKNKINYSNNSIKLPGNKLEYCHKKYLKSRGLDPDYIEEKYKLKGTLYHSKYPYRIIIPVIQNDKIVSYQTRGIVKDQRYINCEPELEIIPIKECLYNLDNCNENYIVVTEGVAKVFKLGENSCATFGKNFTNKQVQLLQRYKKIFIYFDNDEAGISGAGKLSSLLDSLGKEVYIVNNEIAPDNLNENQVQEFWEDIFNFSFV